MTDRIRHRGIVGLLDEGPDLAEEVPEAAPRAACEILGRDDLVRPWDVDGDYDPLAITVGRLVLRPARLAVLDAAFVLRTARARPAPAVRGA